jgi:GalNAc-alpha-(1->4)-GalNAc-alpha-(1->3)-diNAcBac-PP-undecaprenol alpha-1,4-N-acetyl-D-galactosaminyltransferase
LAATRAMGTPVIVAERIDPRAEPISRFWAGTRRLLYPHADGIVVQTPEVRDWALRFVPADKVHVIPNPVLTCDLDSCQESGATPDWLEKAGPKIFAAGRLTRQKGFDVLLRAVAACRAEHPEWWLIILGEGEERSALQEQARRLGIGSAVTLPGYVDGVSRLLRRGDLFVLSSRYEGFPNVLLDAMMCGLPVIATDCPSGPRRIIRDGVDGLLVEPGNVDALTAAMKRLIETPELRKRLASRSVEVRERFSVPGMMQQWDALLTGCSRAS